MNRPLRTRHFEVWLALSMLIPAGMITAWLSVKQPGRSRLLQPASAAVLPKIISTFETVDYVARLRSHDSIPEQLEWINKRTLTVPSAVIYRKVPGGDTLRLGELIGRIEAKGNYYFRLHRDSMQQLNSFVLYDFIHEKIVDSIKLLP